MEGNKKTTIELVQIFSHEQVRQFAGEFDDLISRFCLATKLAPYAAEELFVEGGYLIWNPDKIRLEALLHIEQLPGAITLAICFPRLKWLDEADEQDLFDILKEKFEGTDIWLMTAGAFWRKPSGIVKIGRVGTIK